MLATDLKEPKNFNYIVFKIKDFAWFVNIHPTSTFRAKIWGLDGR